MCQNRSIVCLALGSNFHQNNQIVVSMKLLVAGDLTAKGRIGEKLKTGHFDDVFADLANHINQVDYSILNLETPVVIHEDYNPIPKVGFTLSAPEAIVDMIQQAGFNAVTLANNHILDYGPKALMDTIRLLDEKGIEHVGAGKNLEDASQVLYKTIEDKKLAIINFCENDFSIAEQEIPGAFPLDVVKNVRQIQSAKANADFVVVIVHGGIELYPLPSPWMKEVYRFFVDMGADAVINHHQHCYSGYEVYQNKPIFYGLGNLCFDTKVMDDFQRHVGIIVELSLTDRISFEIIPYRQCGSEAKVTLLEKEEKNGVIEDIHHLNEIIAKDVNLQVEYQKKVNGKTSQVFYKLSPYSGKLYAFLAQKGLLKVTPKKSMALKLLEYLNCDSHRDIARNVLTNYLKK